MDLKMKKQLLEKYWKGETTPVEEQWLKANVSKDEEGLTKEERRYFEQLNAFVDLSPAETFEMAMFEESAQKPAKVIVRPFYLQFRKIAVMILLLLSVGLGTYYMLPSDSASIATIGIGEEEEVEKAFEVAKASLLLISQKMNKGTVHLGALEKFELAQDKIDDGGRK